MKTEKSPPYYAHLSCGQWYIVNSLGGFEIACNNQEQCLLYAAAMSREAEATKEPNNTETKEERS